MALEFHSQKYNFENNLESGVAKAIEDGDLSTLRMILEDEIYKTEERLTHVLRFAILCCATIEIFREILDHLDVNIGFEHKLNVGGVSELVIVNTPLHLAVYLGQKLIVALLIKRGAEVNAKNSDDLTALHIAVAYCDDGMVNQLLDAGADSNAKCSSNEVPIVQMISKNRMNIVESLVSHGADLNTLLRCSGESILQYAMRKTDLTIAKYLINHGADINIQSRIGSLGAILLKRFSDESSQNYNDAYEIIELLICDGYCFAESVIGNLLLSKNVYLYLTMRISEVSSLSALCRRNIREKVKSYSKGNDIWPFIHKLPLPDILKQQVCKMNHYNE